jgi:hypothetical protein
MERFDEGKSVAAIRSELKDEYAEYLEDEDDGPIFWLALSQAQWECGQLQPDVLARALNIITTGKGLERWEEAGDETFEERKQELTQFAWLLIQPNPSPRVRGESGSEEPGTT